jgi:SAM-dependent methyltransferase
MIFLMTMTLTVFIGIGVLLYFIFLIDIFIRGHDLPTSTHATKALVEIIKKEKPDTRIIYDFGCAYGSLALRLKKAFPHSVVCGIDNDAVRIFFASLRSLLCGRKVYFKKQNIFTVDVSDADVVYTYLWYDRMPVLEKKLQQELKKGALVITNTSHFSAWQPIKRVVTYTKPSKLPDFETLFVYRKKE